jgi:CheY-like chemotaxis protein
MTGVVFSDILVADDNPVFREVLEAMLRQWGYNVTTAADGQEAWEILRSPAGPQLVLLDWEMPGLNGLEVCRLVRMVGRPVYIIMVTGCATSPDALAALEAGVDDYLSKPLKSLELRVRLRAGCQSLGYQDYVQRAQVAHPDQESTSTPQPGDVGVC